MKQAIFTFLVLTGINISIFAQLYYLDSTTTGTTITTCSGFLFDSNNGPDGDYGNNENYFITICSPNPNDILQLGPRDIRMTGVDKTVIHDGTDTLAPVLLTVSGGGYIGGYDYTTGNCATIHIVTDSADTRGGIILPITCIPKPQNDLPCEAEYLPANDYCIYTYTDSEYGDNTYTTDPGCADYIGMDLWYKTVVPPSGNIIIDTYEGSITSGGMAVYSGTCSSLSLIHCDDNSSTCCTDMPRYDGSGLTPGDTLWIQIWEEGADAGGYMYLCVTEPLPPPNDSVCDAILIEPGLTCDISYLQFSNENATNSGIPDPGCGNYQGGDVWFKVPVTSTGKLLFDMNGLSIDDAAMAVYSGTCTNLTLIQCDDNSSANPNMPSISLTGQNPTDTVWLRIWENGNDSNGTFELCVTENPVKPSCANLTPANDTCIFASHICDFRGYCGTTDDTYTTINHLGEDENSTNLGQTFFCGGLHNNSWLQFIAADTAITLVIWVDNCSTGQGIQMHMYSTDNCLDFTPVSECIGQMLPGTHILNTTVPLTIGESYFLMIDGFNKDVCDYTITAASGVFILEAVSVETGNDFVSICKGEQTQLSARGGYTFQWSPDSSLSNDTIANPMAFPDTTTTYYVTITGGVDPECPDSGVASVTVHVRNCELAANINGTDPSCNGVCDATATVVPFGIDSSFTIEWDHGLGTDSTVTGLCGGTTYNVTITDTSGRKFYTSYTPVEPPPLYISFNNTEPSDSGVCDATIQASVTNGISPFSYQWDPGLGDTSFVSGLCGDSTYFLTVTDSNMCTAEDSIYIPEAPVMHLTAFGEDPDCYGECTGVMGVIVSGGSGNYTFIWDAPGNPEDSLIFGICANNRYTVTVTDTTLGIYDTASYMLDSPPEMLLTTDTTHASCFDTSDGSATVHATGGTPPYSFLWDDSGTQTDSNAVNLAAGDYKVIVTDANNCKDSAIVTVTEPAEFIPVIQEGPDITICRNDTITLHVTAGISYSWSPAANIEAADIQNPRVYPIASTTYMVTVQDSNGCPNTADIDITVQPPPDAGQNGNAGVCANGAAINLFDYLNGSPETGGTWQNPSAGIHNGSFDPAVDSPGTYTYTVSGGGICEDAIATVNVQILPVPVYSIHPYPDTTIYINRDAQIRITGDSSYTYYWQPDDESLSNTNTSSLVASPQSTTTFYVTITDTSTANDCNTSDSVIINVKSVTIIIYNTFTPNGDDVNDTWIIENIEDFPDNEIMIYNRIGMLVCKKKGYKNNINDWDGTNCKTGEVLPAASYYYVIDLGKGGVIYTGNVSLIK